MLEQKGLVNATDFEFQVSLVKTDSTNNAIAFPALRWDKIETSNIEWQIQDLVPRNSIVVLSGQPGIGKTWLSLELAISVCAKGKAFGFYQASAGKVLLFNSEDAPGAVTKPRIEAMCRGKQVNDLQNLFFLDTHTLHLDDEQHQAKFAKTMEEMKPDLVVLDPFRNLHHANENDASQMAPILGFIRELQRKYGCSFLVVFHDRKPGEKDSSGSRGNRIRGSSAVEGWRDSCIFLDKEGDGPDATTRLSVYHRGSRAPEPFSFNLITENTEVGLTFAQLKFCGDVQFDNNQNLALGLISKKAATMTEVVKNLRVNRQKGYDLVRDLLRRGIIEKNGEKKLILKTTNGLNNGAQFESNGSVPGTVPAVLFPEHSE
jgi:hypothetical protein